MSLAPFCIDLFFVISFISLMICFISLMICFIARDLLHFDNDDDDDDDIFTRSFHRDLVLDHVSVWLSLPHNHESYLSLHQ